jgi:redox-sensitive bicupin YhaK (pirin superfamily)
MGSLGGVTSPARHDTELLGVELDLRGGSAFGVDSSYEHGIVVLEGAISIDGVTLTPGHLGFVPPGRDALAIEPTEATRAILLGGEPFTERPYLWWNFVARSRAEVEVARREWMDDTGRFGTVDSALARTPAPELD